MIANGLPVSLNLSMVSGVENTYEFEVADADIRFYTFGGILRAPGGEESELTVTLAGENVLVVTFPAVEPGEYDWALYCSTSEGEQEAIVSGVLGVFWPELSSGEVVASPNRRCIFSWKGGTAVARWKKSGYVDAAVKRAEESAERAEEALSGIKSETKVIEGFLAIFDGKVAGMAAIDPSTGHLIIGGVDLGVKVTGEHGKSPYVDENGHWVYWNEDLKRWEDGGPVRVDGFSPYVNEAGYWVYKDPLTGAEVTGPRAMGIDGVDGSTVRRILVDSYEDIPQSGDTCNGGHLYYVRGGNVASASARAMISLPSTAVALQSYSTGDHLLTIGGEPVYATTNSGTDKNSFINGVFLSLLSARAGLPVNPTLRVAGGRYEILLIAKMPGYEYNSIGLESVNSSIVFDSPELYGGRSAIPWEVYAWLEPDGWTKVDIKYDVASTQTLGMMKYGTDSILEGAPVGKNVDGQATVAYADASTPGVLKTAGRTLETCAPVYTNANNEAVVPLAGKGSRPGAVMVSSSSSVEPDIANSVRCLDVGWLGVLTASVDYEGVLKVGAVVDSFTGNGTDYVVIPAVDSEHRIGFDVLSGGALMYMGGGRWKNTAMPWLDSASTSSPELYADTAMYFGLRTSASFTQTEENGLELKEATKTTLGGVKVAGTLGGVGNGVLLDKHLHAIKGFIGGLFVQEGTFAKGDAVYTKDEVYTKEQADARYMRAGESGSFVQSGLGNCKKINVVTRAQFETMTRVEGEIYLIKR